MLHLKHFSFVLYCFGLNFFFLLYFLRLSIYLTNLLHKFIINSGEINEMVMNVIGLVKQIEKNKLIIRRPV